MVLIAVHLQYNANVQITVPVETVLEFLLIDVTVSKKKTPLKIVSGNTASVAGGNYSRFISVLNGKKKNRVGKSPIVHETVQM